MKKLLILLFILSFTSATFAQKVSEQQALHKAQNFFKDKGIISKNPRRSVKKSMQQQTEPAQEDFYVFNVENKGGFVIISGDERTPEILGYAESGSLDMDTLPPNIKWWLSEYSKQIKAIDSLGITKRSASRRAPKPAIATLMSTKWGQDDPYNMNCPAFFDKGYNCVTGCVATAMAQVMYYHRTKSINKTTAKMPGYKGTYWQGLGQLTIDEIPKESIIDWDNMLDIYDGSETSVQKEAVANLMLYCGTSVKMDYGIPSALSGGSSAYSFDIPGALKQYFDYSENTTLVWRQDYTEEDWDELIYSELSIGNPVYYSGYNSSAGHAFVCDGYDGNGYYHINWGWDGLSDSFFLLDALNPNQQGTGGSSAGYNDAQCALIGAVPNGDIMRLTSQSVSLTGNTSFNLSETGDNITVPVRWEVQNMTGTSYSFDHAIGLYYKDELVKVLKETGTSEMFTANQEKTIDTSLVIETNLSTGIYQLYALSRSQGEEKWFRNENSYDCYITLVKKDGSMSFYVGKPAVAENVINFADDEVKRICVENWDTDGDGEISYDEAAAVTDFGYVFDRSIIKTFDEAQYFTGITSFGITSSYGFGCMSLESITLPPSITSIRNGAFFCCLALKSIIVPASVKTIEDEAFANCLSLQEITLQEGVEVIKNKAFSMCQSLSSISIPASVTSLGDNLWFECTNLNDFYVDDSNVHYCSIDGVIFTKDEKELVYFPCKREGIYNIPEGTEVVNSHAFTSSRIEFVNIPPSVTSIGREAFGSMMNLHEITIPSTVTNVATHAVFGCVNLKRAFLTGNRSTIPEGMFGGCWSLKNIDFPTGLTSIGPYAFWDCDKLFEITIPASVTSIGDYAFANSGLRIVTSHINNPCTITSTVFNNINPNAILYVPEESLDAYKAADNWKNFSQILPIGQTGIEPYVEFHNGVLSFHYDTNRNERDGETYEITENYSWLENSNDITKVIFDASFADVHPTATIHWFKGCDKLTEIQGIENLNTSEVTNMAGMFSRCSSLTNIDLSHFNTSKVTSMSAMFWGCSNLKTIILPDDLTFIDSWQFVYCSSLTDISIPSSVTSIGERAFHCCYSLKEITIPADVTSIGDNAFSSSGLTKVTSLMQTPCDINSGVFEGIGYCAALFVPEESIDAYKVADHWKNFSQIIPIGEKAKEPYAEYYNGGLTFYYDINRDERDGTTYDIRYEFLRSIALHDIKNAITKVTFDTSFAHVKPNSTRQWFEGFENLITIQGIENLNTSEVINMWDMFSGCRSLTSIDLSHFNTSKVTSMSAMFWGCSNLKTIILPDDLTFIDSWQFVYCSSLTDISIPSSVTSIGERAFHCCYSLKEITIPADVTSIGDNAFSSSGLTKVTSLMQTPCVISSTVFENVSNNATLYVPAGCKAAYEAADYWKDFKKIMGPSSNLIYMVDGEVYRSYEIEHGSVITPEPAPTKEGYTFSGWSEIPETMPAHDVTVTGTFSINKYKLTYIVDGEVYKSYDIEYGASITPEAEPTKEGYTFSGWSTIPTTMPAYDVTITGSFTKGAYKLTYMLDGVVYKTISYDYGDAITPEPAPTKEGYTFSGWSEIPATMPAHDVTVTGTFSINKYKLTYTVDGVEYKSYDIEYGATITPEVEPTKEGYTFSGWSTIPETMPGHDVTITGSFIINKYKLTYIVDGEVYKSYDIEYGASITPEAEPTKEGYTFSGWSTIPTTMPAYDVTITGSFTKGAYKLTYMLDGVVYKTISYDYGDAITPEPAPTKEGYTFSGWSEIPETMPAHDVTVTGTFSINKYKLTYIVDGVEYKSYDIEYGASITPEAEPTKEGYTFSGWSEIPATMPAHDVTVTGTFTLDTGIEQIMSNANGDIMIFTIDGKRVDNLKKGMNVIRMKDGTTRKVVVK